MSSRIAIITGASRGLGRSAAIHLARRGVDIVGTYRVNEAEARGTATAVEEAGARAVMLRLDVADHRGFANFAAAVGEALTALGSDRFDYLVNNAGIGLRAPMMDTTPEQFDQLIAIHVKAPLLLSQALLPMLRDGGRILNVSSGLSRFVIPGNGVYAAAKAATEVMTRYMAHELGERQIRVNIIAPGAIETDFGGGAVRDNDTVNQMIAGATALGRAGLPDDVGSAIAAILSDDFGWVTGQRIEVSGGQSL